MDLATWAEVFARIGTTQAISHAMSQLQWRERLATSALMQSASDHALTSKALAGVVQTAMLTTGAWLVISANASSGVMLAATILLGRALQPIQAMAASWQNVKDGWAARGRLNAWLQTSLRTERSTTSDTTILTLDSVNFGYRGGGQMILHLANLAVKGGESVLIVGDCASGKSTLLDILSGRLNPLHGTASLNGVRTDAMRRGHSTAVGLMPQESITLRATVAENIRGAVHDSKSEVSLVDVEFAAKLAGIHDWILTLPQGYSTMVGRGGSHLTQVQRRFIDLARACYGVSNSALWKGKNRKYAANWRHCLA